MNQRGLAVKPGQPTPTANEMRPLFDGTLGLQRTYGQMSDWRPPVPLAIGIEIHEQRQLGVA